MSQVSVIVINEGLICEGVAESCLQTKKKPAGSQRAEFAEGALVSMNLGRRHVVVDFMRERMPSHCELEIVLSEAWRCRAPFIRFVSPLLVFRRELRAGFSLCCHARAPDERYCRFERFEAFDKLIPSLGQFLVDPPCLR